MSINVKGSYTVAKQLRNAMRIEAKRDATLEEEIAYVQYAGKIETVIASLTKSKTYQAHQQLIADNRNICAEFAAGNISLAVFNDSYAKFLEDTQPLTCPVGHKKADPAKIKERMLADAKKLGVYNEIAKILEGI